MTYNIEIINGFTLSAEIDLTTIAQLRGRGLLIDREGINVIIPETIVDNAPDIIEYLDTLCEELPNYVKLNGCFTYEKDIFEYGSLVKKILYVTYQNSYKSCLNETEYWHHFNDLVFYDKNGSNSIDLNTLELYIKRMRSEGFSRIDISPIMDEHYHLGNIFSPK